jgi:ketosteroid isomerase-like protein
MADDETGALIERIDLLESRLAILDLEGSYSRTWDVGDAAGWSELFTEDGVFVVAAVGRKPEQRIVGRSSLEEMCRNFTAKITGLHLLHLPELTVEADRASSRLHFEFRSVRRDIPNYSQDTSMSGYYDTTYRREDNRWRIALRREVAVAVTRSEFHDI